MKKKEAILSIVIAILGGVSFFVFWFNLNKILTNGFDLIIQPLEYTHIWLPFLLSISSILTTFIISTVLIEKVKLRAVFWAIAGLTTFTMYEQFEIQLLLTASVVLFVTLGFMDKILTYDIQLHTKPNINHIFGHKLGYITLILTVLVSFLVFQTGSLNLDNLTVEVPESLIDQSLNITLPFLETSLAGQANDFFVDETIRQLETQLPILTELPYEDKRALLSGDVSEATRTLLNNSGIPNAQIDLLAEQIATAFTQNADSIESNPAEEITSRVKLGVIELINNFFETNKNYIPWILSVSAFLLLNSLGFLYRILAVVLASLLLQLLLWTNIIEIIRHEVEVTSYSIKE